MREQVIKKCYINLEYNKSSKEVSLGIKSHEIGMCMHAHAHVCMYVCIHHSMAY